MDRLLSRLNVNALILRLKPLIHERWFRISAGLLAAYALFGFFAVPALIRHYVPQEVTQRIQRPLSLGKVSFNPFLFRLDIQDTVLTETNQQAIVALKRLHVDFELLRTLFYRAPTFAELRLEGPSVRLVQDKEGVLNMARISESLPDDPAQEPSPENEPPPRLVLQRIVLTEGEISFENQSQEPAIINRADHLDLELNNLSTLPEHHGVYEIDAALPEEGRLHWKGDVSLNPMKSSGSLTVEALKVATLWRFVQDRVALSEPAGDIGFSALYHFNHDKTNTQLNVEEATFTLAGLKLATVEPPVPLADLESFRIDHTRVDLAAQTVEIPGIELRKGRINLAFDAAGRLNWQTVVKTAPESSPTVASPLPQASAMAAEAPQPWKVTLGQLTLAEFGVDYADARPGVEAKGGISDIGLTLKGEATAGGESAPEVHMADIGLHFKQIELQQKEHPLVSLADVSLEQISLDLPQQKIRIPVFSINKGQLSAAMNAEGQLNWQALAPNPAPSETEEVEAPPTSTPESSPSAPWQIAVDQFRLQELALDYTDDSHKAPIRASLGALGVSLKADASIESPPKAVISDIDVQLSHLAVDETQSERSLLKWDEVKLEGGLFDLEKQAVSMGRLALKGGGTAMALDAGGKIYPMSLFESESPSSPDPHPAKAPTNTANATPWQFNLGEFSVDGFGFGFGVKDQSLAGELAYDLDDITLSVRNIANSGTTPVSYKLGTKIRQGGALTIAGTASPKGDTAKALLQLDRFSLLQFQPLLSDFAALTMEGANLSTQLTLDFHQATPTPKVRVTGDANLANLNLTQSKDGKKFLAWNNLLTKGIDFSLTPDKLSIKELRLIGPDSVIAIHEDKSSNVSDIIKPQKANPSTTPTVSAGAGKPAKAEPAFPVSIGRILVEKGKVDFSDASLVLPFATQVHDFGGSMAGFALTPQSRMTLQLTGKVDEYGETRVDGSLSPMDIKQFSDINVVFRNVTMSSLSPYSATFAGRRIESGKLDLDLEYRIENHLLKSQNKVTLEQFKLGDAVESPNATSLPLDLAIALLTDAEGKIQASVPIEGTLDDPKFAYGTVVWNAVTTLITNAATAPFKALGSLVGSGEGEPGAVAFDAGSAEIPPPEREKLQKLAAGLATKDQLQLTVHGGTDKKADTTALKALAIRHLVADGLDIELAPGERPDAVNVSDAATQRVLEKLASASGLADRLAAEYAKDKGHPPERMGVMSGLLGRTSQTPDFYEQVLAGLEDQSNVSASQLDALADQRAQAVISELIDRQNFARERISMGPPQAAKETEDKRVAIRLELGL